MLHAKFKVRRISGLGGEDFSIYGQGGYLGHVTRTIYINFRSPFARRLHIKFGFDWPSDYRGEDVLNCLRRRQQQQRRRQQRTSEHGYTISSPYGPEGSGKLKNRQMT